MLNKTYRIISLFLIVAILVSVVSIVSVFSAEDSETKNVYTIYYITNEKADYSLSFGCNSGEQKTVEMGLYKDNIYSCNIEVSVENTSIDNLCIHSNETKKTISINNGGTIKLGINCFQKLVNKTFELEDTNDKDLDKASKEMMPTVPTNITDPTSESDSQTTDATAPSSESTYSPTEKITETTEEPTQIQPLEFVDKIKKVTTSYKKGKTFKITNDKKETISTNDKTAKITYKSQNTKVVSVKDNTKFITKGCGKATITVTAKNSNKTISKNVTLIVIPGKPIFTVHNVYNKKLKRKVVELRLKNQQKKCTKYQIYISSNKKFKKDNRGENTYSSKTKVITLKPPIGKRFFAKIRAYKTIDGVKKYGAWSKEKKYKL